MERAARLHGAVGQPVVSWTLPPWEGLVVNGLHHEVYLSDPAETDPEKMRTILRQPVR